MSDPTGPGDPRNLDPRVLVVDDSAFARKVVREVLEQAGVEVAGIARDGLEALEQIDLLKPDVVTLDLVMPNLDGLGVLAALPPQGGPRVVVVSMSGEDSALGIAALHAGAVEVVKKPTALATDRLYEMGSELVSAVKTAALARVPARRPAPARVALALPVRTSKSVLVLGASTGGPQALTRVITSLPKEFPLPAALVLHLPAGYTQSFAERLDRESELEVVEASEGMEMRVGRLIVARAGSHLRFVQQGGEVRCHLDDQPESSAHRPSVDVLFESASQIYGAGVLAVVLTGMGDDGTRGARAIHAAGGEIVTEAESSCVVYGMPRCVAEAGLSAASVPLDAMTAEILKRV